MSYSRVFAWKALKSDTLLNKVKLRKRVFTDTRMNAFTHSNVHQAVIQYVQFTFAQNMNAFCIMFLLLKSSVALGP